MTCLDVAAAVALFALLISNIARWCEAPVRNGRLRDELNERAPLPTARAVRGADAVGWHRPPMVPSSEELREGVIIETTRTTSLTVSVHHYVRPLPTELPGPPESVSK